jgi:hypothetical protein
MARLPWALSEFNENDDEDKCACAMLRQIAGIGR